MRTITTSLISKWIKGRNLKVDEKYWNWYLIRNYLSRLKCIYSVFIITTHPINVTSSPMEREFQALKKGKAEMAASIDCENLEVDDKRYVLLHTPTSFLSLPVFSNVGSWCKMWKEKNVLTSFLFDWTLWSVKMPSSSKA